MRLSAGQAGISEKTVYKHLLKQPGFVEAFSLAMQLLRAHRRHLPGSAEKRPAQRTTAEAASNKEVAEALQSAAGDARSDAIMNFALMSKRFTN